MKSVSLSPSSWPRWVRALAFGALFGMVGYGVGGWLAKVAPGGLGLTDKAIRWSDALALVVGPALVLGSLWALYVSLDARRLGRMYDLEGDASAEETAVARFQAAVMGFSGVLLALPIVVHSDSVRADALSGIAEQRQFASRQRRCVSIGRR